MGALANLETAVIFTVITVFCLAFFFAYYREAARPLAGTTEWIDRIVNRPRLTFFASRCPMEKKDIAPVIIFLAVFSFLAFFRLGDNAAPTGFFQFSEERREVIIELAEPEEIRTLMFYSGLWTGNYTLELSADGAEWLTQEPKGDHDHAMDQQSSDLFKWRYADINDDNPPVRYIRITPSRVPMELGELALYGADGSLIPVWDILAPDAPELFDERELVPEKPTYMNGMYFDEIYHGRTAFEHLRGVYPYETTHPPLGKEIIAASVAAFGMNPFGWRFAGALFGVLMLLALYIFVKNMFGKTMIAVCVTLLFGFDFMRFTQTRIATIDTYAVIFILLSYFFMYRHITTNPDAPFRKSLAPLALSGIFFGIGCAAKWVTVYAGFGLLAIYLLRIFMLWGYYDENKKSGFSGYLTKTLVFSALFFVAVPACIYCLSYIPYGLARGMTLEGGMLGSREFYDIILENQKSMFSYHGKLVAEHPYSSWWFQWIVDGRPILYYRDFAGNMTSIIAAFGNPVVWWGGLIAMGAMAVRAVGMRDGKALFILIGYLSQLLPWVFVSRIVFVYHYFPSTLFLVLALGHVFNTILERRQGRYRQAVCVYTAAAGALFVMFYPVLSGAYAPGWYFRYFLRWIPGAWPF